jgi:hypothetical protein
MRLLRLWIFRQKLNFSDSREAIIALNRFTLEPWKIVPSIAVYPLYSPMFPLRPSLPLYGPLSPLLPSVPSTALCPLYGPMSLYGPLPLLRPSLSLSGFCLFYSSLSSLQPSIPSTALCHLYGPLSPLKPSAPLYSPLSSLRPYVSEKLLLLKSLLYHLDLTILCTLNVPMTPLGTHTYCI